MHFSSIGGIDYAKNLVDYARRIFKDYKDCFLQKDANYIKVIDPVDLVCSFSVMHYFKDLDYAYDVIYHMFKQAKKCVLCLDILDEQEKQADISYKKQVYGKEYEKFYGALPHLYYPKEMFFEIAKQFDFNCEIVKQDIKNYPNSAFRFNVIARRS